MNELVKIIADELGDLLEYSGIRCIINDEVLIDDRIVMYLAGPKRYALYAIIIFDFPEAKLITLEPYTKYARQAWRESGQYYYELANPDSIGLMFDVIKIHYDKIPGRGTNDYLIGSDINCAHAKF